MQTVTQLSSEDRTLEWKTIGLSNTSPRPCMRWGHSSCIVDHTLYIFGGFANSNYMNDLWAYKDAQWHQINTFGDIPEKRSNATLSYDPINQQLLLFGGGGPNKQRFNAVSTLDLHSLNWLQISPFQSDSAPWERTYHAAEFAYPYLVVFGGEGADDLDDLWTYDVRSLRWTEVKTPEPKLCARRFHASCLVGQTLYLFGGCHGKYISLNDLHALNLAPLLRTGNHSQLQWQKLSLKGSVTQRWGHTMTHYNNQLFIFGGRSTEDLNDLTSIELSTMFVQILQTQHVPNARRRHGGGMIGSSLVLFGGFDGNYYDDLFYINLYQPQQPVLQILTLTETESPDHITSSDGKNYQIWPALLGRHFHSEQDLATFLEEIKQKYSIEELELIFSTLYRGWGKLPLSECHQQYLLNMPEKEEQNNSQLVHAFMEWPYLALETDKSCVELQGRRFQEYLSALEDHWQMNRVVLLNNEHPFLCCDKLLALRSPYFHALLSSNYHSTRTVALELPCPPNIFHILMAYLHTNILVMPQHSPPSMLTQLAELAEYLSLEPLFLLCEQLLCQALTASSYPYLLRTSQELRMERLEELCAMRHLYQLVRTSKGRIQEERLEGRGRQLYREIEFDLMHIRFERGPARAVGKGKENEREQKVPRKVSSD